MFHWQSFPFYDNECVLDCFSKMALWKENMLRGFKNANTNKNHKNISLLKLKLGGRSGASPVFGPSLLSHTFHQWPFCFQVNLVNFDCTFILFFCILIYHNFTAKILFHHKELFGVCHKQYLMFTYICYGSPQREVNKLRNYQGR